MTTDPQPYPRCSSPRCPGYCWKPLDRNGNAPLHPAVTCGDAKEQGVAPIPEPEPAPAQEKP